MKLSIIIPVFNEKDTIKTILERIESVSFDNDINNLDNVIEKEIIIVDDCSTDGTRDILNELKQYSLGQNSLNQSLSDQNNLIVVLQDNNQGKGSAVRVGFQKASGDIILIQDADLEYDPQEYPRLIEPIVRGDADVVYGSRFMGSEAKRVLFFWHYLGNKFLTTFSNLLTNINLTDMETCYKVFNKKALDSFKDRLTAKRFGIEPEITAQVAKQKLRIYEVGIAYNGRTYEEGKKINWKDGLAAIWHIIKYNVFR